MQDVHFIANRLKKFNMPSVLHISYHFVQFRLNWPFFMNHVLQRKILNVIQKRKSNKQNSNCIAEEQIRISTLEVWISDCAKHSKNDLKMPFYFLKITQVSGLTVARFTIVYVFWNGFAHELVEATVSMLLYLTKFVIQIQTFYIGHLRVPFISSSYCELSSGSVQNKSQVSRLTKFSTTNFAQEQKNTLQQIWIFRRQKVCSGVCFSFFSRFFTFFIHIQFWYFT